MASLLGRVFRLARSPQGRRLIGQAQKAARDPKTRRRLEGLRGRLKGRP